MHFFTMSEFALFSRGLLICYCEEFCDILLKHFHFVYTLSAQKRDSAKKCGGESAKKVWVGGESAIAPKKWWGGGGVKRNSAKIWRVSDDDLTVMYVHHDI